MPVYLAGRTLLGRRAGLFSALALTTFPFHVRESHLATFDIPMLFWFSWALYFAGRILKDGTWQDYTLAGAFTGLATSTKYSGALISVGIVLAHILRMRRLLRRGKGFRPSFGREGLKLILSGAASVFGFLVGTPYALLDFKTFIVRSDPRGALWQFENVGSVSSFEVYLGKVCDTFGRRFWVDFGLAFWAIFLWSLLEFLLVSKRSPETAFLTLPPLVYFLYITKGNRSPSHYYLPGYPFIALMVGRFVSNFLRFWEGRKGRTLRRCIPIGFLLFVFFPAIYLSLRQDLRFARADTRTLASRWVDEEVSPGAAGAIVGTRDIEIIKDGVSEDHFGDLSALENLEKYEFLIVTKVDLAQAKAELSEEGFSLVREISSEGRCGPDVLIFRKTSPL